MPTWANDPERYRIRRNCDGDLVLFLNGILTKPSDQHGWTDRAERWIQDYTAHECDSVEYFHGPILGPILDSGRVYREAIALLRGYQAEAVRTSGRPLRLHLVGHSRGCAIARRLIVESGLRFRSAHFFAAAIDADLEGTGLNTALASGRLQELGLYCSRGDGVLRWIAPLGMGIYGRLGYTGPKNMRAEVERRVRVVMRDDVGHSGWFAPGEFWRSMEMVEHSIDQVPGAEAQRNGTYRTDGTYGAR